MLAERVFAPDLRRATGRIGLRLTPGGFGQPEHTVDGRRRRVRLDGTRLAMDGDAEGESWHELSTLGAAWELLGLPVGAEPEVYDAGSTADPDFRFDLDPLAASELTGWLAFAAEAMEELRRRHAAERPPIVQLWPEHFDLSTSLASANFGASPGDAGGSEGGGRAEPYLYVGPWSPPPVGGFWNEPYGAALSWTAVDSIADALEFFEAGLRAVSAVELPPHPGA